MTSGECPTGCGRRVGVGKLMCLSCWREVPKFLQTEVYAALRAWRAAPIGEKKGQAWERYNDARNAAIASIE